MDEGVELAVLATGVERSAVGPRAAPRRRDGGDEGGVEYRPDRRRPVWPRSPPRSAPGRQRDRRWRARRRPSAGSPGRWPRGRAAQPLFAVGADVLEKRSARRSCSPRERRCARRRRPCARRSCVWSGQAPGCTISTSSGPPCLGLWTDRSLRAHLGADAVVGRELGRRRQPRHRLEHRARRATPEAPALSPCRPLQRVRDCFGAVVRIDECGGRPDDQIDHPRVPRPPRWVGFEDERRTSWHSVSSRSA